MNVINIKKSCLASLLIACGVAIQLTIGNPLGAFLFAFGLLGVCVLEANLFTGKAGYLWKKEPFNLFIILIFNLVSGWIIGFLLGIANNSLVIEAENRIATWDFSINFFIKSIFCGIIMYIAVETFKRKNIMGIFYGVPLFILCSFQHCIANIIILGIAKTFSFTIFIAIIGNLIGSIIMNLLMVKQE